MRWRPGWDKRALFPLCPTVPGCPREGSWPRKNTYQWKEIQPWIKTVFWAWRSHPGMPICCALDSRPHNQLKFAPTCLARHGVRLLFAVGRPLVGFANISHKVIHGPTKEPARKGS